MRQLLILAAIAGLAAAKPGTYRETEDFKYSRSSSDQGTKSGYYGTQRGNMGGNYEKAHNMDIVAQNQMSGLVRSVQGELGDGLHQRTGSVYTAANSRGIYGSGANYDLSNLGGRNFQEGESYDDSKASFASHQNSAYSNQYSSNNARHNNAQIQNAGFDSTRAHDGGYASTLDRNEAFNANGYSQSSGYSRHSSSANSNQAIYSTNQQLSNLQSGNQYQGRNTEQLLLAGGNQGHVYDQASSLGIHNRLVSGTPVKVIIRPGTRVSVPVAAQTYDASQSSSSLNENRDSAFVSKPQVKNYESSYSYNKEWEKHDTQPVSGVSVYPKNSELYEDEQSRLEEQRRLNALSSQSHRSSSASGYNANSSSSRQHYTKQQSNVVNSGYQSNYGHGASDDSNHQRLNNGASNLNLVDGANTNPKSYQSSYSYHKSWERQGDPYVIVPTGTEGQLSGKLTAGSMNQGNSQQYGSQQHHSNSYRTHNCDDRCVVRKARSYNLDQVENLGQQTQDAWHELGQQSQNIWDQAGQQTQNSWEQLGQQTQKQMDKLEDFGQQTQNSWDQLGQQTQKQMDKLEDFGQQTQNSWDHLGQQTQKQMDKLEDFGQQTQNSWDELGQQTQKQMDKLEDFGQQTQNSWDQLGQQAQKQMDKLEAFGQQTQNSWDQLGQQTQNQMDSLEDLGQQTQNTWEDFGQQTQNTDNQMLQSQSQTNMGQQTQDFWSAQQTYSTGPMEQKPSVLNISNHRDNGMNQQSRDNTFVIINSNNHQMHDTFEDGNKNKSHHYFHTFWDVIKREETGQENENTMEDQNSDLGQQTQVTWDNKHQKENNPWSFMEEDKVNLLLTTPKPQNPENSIINSHPWTHIHHNNETGLNQYLAHHSASSSSHSHSWTEDSSYTNSGYNTNAQTNLNESRRTILNLWDKLSDFDKLPSFNSGHKQTENKTTTNSIGRHNNLGVQHIQNKPNDNGETHSKFTTIKPTVGKVNVNVSSDIGRGDIGPENSNEENESNDSGRGDIGSEISYGQNKPSSVVKNDDDRDLRALDKQQSTQNKEEQLIRHNINGKITSTTQRSYNIPRAGHFQNQDQLNIVQQVSNNDFEFGQETGKGHNTDQQVDYFGQQSENFGFNQMEIQNTQQKTMLESFNQQQTGENQMQQNTQQIESFNQEQKEDNQMQQTPQQIESFNQQQVEEDQMQQTAQQIESFNQHQTEEDQMQQTAQQIESFNQQQTEEDQMQQTAQQIESFNQQQTEENQMKQNTQQIDFNQQQTENFDQQSEYFHILPKPNNNVYKSQKDNMEIQDLNPQRQLVRGWTEIMEPQEKQTGQIPESYLPIEHLYAQLESSQNMNGRNQNQDTIPWEPEETQQQRQFNNDFRDEMGNLEQQVQNAADLSKELQQQSKQADIFSQVEHNIPYNKNDKIAVLEEIIVPKKATTDISTPEEVTEKPGFWKSIGNKFSNAKDKVSSWFSGSPD